MVIDYMEITNMRYNEYVGSLSNIPQSVIDRQFRNIRMYGDNVIIGYSFNLGWFLFERQEDGDLLIWSQALS
jgi:hypothetical protein